MGLVMRFLRGTGDLQCDSRESFAIETSIFIARQADSHESLEFPILVIRANRANRFARITPLSEVLYSLFPVNLVVK